MGMGRRIDSAKHILFPPVRHTPITPRYSQRAHDGRMAQHDACVRASGVGLWYGDADDRQVVRREAREGVSLVTGGLGVKAGPASRECPVFGQWYVELTTDGPSFRASRVARHGRSRRSGWTAVSWETRGV